MTETETETLKLFVAKHINPVHMNCHGTDKYVLELYASTTVEGSSLGKVREREEHRLYHPLRESTNYPHWEAYTVRACVCACMLICTDFDR